MSGSLTATMDNCDEGSTVECSMCGDVGFPEQLHQCKACPRVQHIYCSISKDGLETGDWLCDWCRAERQRKLPKAEKHIIVDMKETTLGFSQCTLNSPDSGLEFLIKAVLSSKDEFFPTAGSFGTGSGAPAGEPSPTADCGSNCSSSVESEKVNVGMQSASCGLGDASSNSRERRVTIDTCISDEEGSIGTVQMRTTSAACDIKRSPSSLRCSVRGSKGTKQKQLDVVKTLKSQLSLPSSRHSGPAPLKRLSSLKVLSRSNNITIEENPPRGLVRRYKSLSDICY